MPRAYYAAKIACGEIADEDLAAALSHVAHTGAPPSVTALKRAAETDRPLPEAVTTVAELAAAASGIDWPALREERFGVWAGGYFGAGQAVWSMRAGLNAWGGWRAGATHGLTPALHGLAGFSTAVEVAPRDPALVIAEAAATLGLTEDMLETYFHQMLLSLGGWSQVARYKLWQAELAGDSDDTLAGLLAARLTWERAFWDHYGVEIGPAWEQAKAAHAVALAPSGDDIVDAILQQAADLAAQRSLAETLALGQDVAPETDRPAVQAAFCIDVRSEVFRRALETTDPSIQTLGFAGFFGITTRHKCATSDVAEHRLPVLLSHGLTSHAPVPEAEDLDARYTARARRAWGRFKLAAVSSFAFVEAAGPLYAGKLVKDALAQDGAKAAGRDDPAPVLDTVLDLETKIASAETVLRAMSLTEIFARIVLLAGHGAAVTNNAHASALQCGACGGYSGEVNARLLAGLLNDADVRAGLSTKGIEVPADTLFLAGLHDTTTDHVTLYDQDMPSPDHASDISQLRRWLKSAGVLARTERAPSLPGATDEASVAARAQNWAELRPEWALAGCKAFIAAPRARTAGRSLEGRAFLHDYAWEPDGARGFPVLELILTAPVVVASWISLQYYGSTVAPDAFGGGNKLLHNVVGGVGVIEGNGGPLRAGLPWQSVHDGDSFRHEPLRLSVCVEAPTAAMSDILARHDGVRALFDNGWLHLFAMDATGLTQRYTGQLSWAPVTEERLRAVA